jgi:hypothetical protein
LAEALQKQGDNDKSALWEDETGDLRPGTGRLTTTLTDGRQRGRGRASLGFYCG